MPRRPFRDLGLLRRATLLLLLLPACRSRAIARPERGELPSLGPGPGSFEVAVGGLAAGPNGIRGQAAIDLGLGYHTTANDAVQVRQRTLYFEDDSARSANLLDATFEHSFGSAALRPFAGGSVGAAYGESVNESPLLGARLGLRWFVQPRASLTMDGAYHHLITKTEDRSEIYRRDLFTWSIGISLFF